MTRARRQFQSRQKDRFAAAAMQTDLFASLSGNRLVRANQKDGLGLAIRAAKTGLRVGEPLKLLLVYENLTAKGDVSATTCQGFSLASEDETTGVATSVDVSFSCPPDDRFRDANVPLRRGQLRTAEVTTADTKLTFDHPGRYIVLAGWQSFRPADGMFVRGSEYATITSNPILIIVR